MSGTATFALRAGGRSDAVGRVGAAIALVLCAMIFNLVLAVINTSIAPIAEAHVISAEVAIVAAAVLLIGGGSTAFFGVAGIVGVWLASTMAVRGQLDPKICRDALIPVVFYFLGRRYGTPRTCDRLVGLAIVLVAIGALLEWAFLDVYLRMWIFCATISPRAARSRRRRPRCPSSTSVACETTAARSCRSWAITASRRSSSNRSRSEILEPSLSPGYFCARPMGQHDSSGAASSSSSSSSWVMPDSASICAASSRSSTPLRPFCGRDSSTHCPSSIVPLLLVNATGFEEAPWLNDLPGRLLLSGQLLSTIDAAQAFGVRATTSAAMVVLSDSGYASIIAEFGAIGAAGLGALFVFASPAESRISWRFKLFVCFYLIVLLTISTSFLSIKTAALLWFSPAARATV